MWDHKHYATNTNQPKITQEHVPLQNIWYVRSKLFWASKLWPQERNRWFPVPSRPNTTTFRQHGEGKDSCYRCIFLSLEFGHHHLYMCPFCVAPLSLHFWVTYAGFVWFYGLFLDGFFSSFIDDQTCKPWQSRPCETVTGREARSMWLGSNKDGPLWLEDGDLDGKKFWISGKLPSNWKMRMFNRKYSRFSRGRFSVVMLVYERLWAVVYVVEKKVGIDFGWFWSSHDPARMQWL